MGASTVGVREALERGGGKVKVSQVGVAGSLVLKSAVLNRSHKVNAILLTLSADGTIKFAGSVSGDLTGAMDVAAKGGFSHANLGDLIETAPNEDLLLVTTGGGANGVVKVVTE